MITVGWMRGRGKKMACIGWRRTANAFALMHGIELFHFREKDIDFPNKRILGEFWDVDKGCYVEKITPIPEIIHDNRFWPKDKIRRKLINNGVTFTWIDLESKKKVDEVLRKTPIKNYLIDTFDYNTVDINEIIDKYQEVILKPRNSLSGKGIYKLSRNEGTYLLHSGHEKKELSSEEFNVYENLFREENYLVQEYIASQTNDGKPFDVKVYLIRSGDDANWEHLPLLPRIGSSLGVVSNVASGGNAFVYSDKFLEEEFGEDWAEIDKQMQEMLYSLPQSLQTGYNETLNTLGVDIGFDRRTNKIKIFEVNGTISGTPNRMEFCEQAILLFKRVHKEMQEKKISAEVKKLSVRKHAILPSHFLRVKKEAFKGSIALRKVTVPKSTIEIQAKTFADCKNLREIIIPPGVKSVADDAFVNCPKLKIVGVKDSYAQNYAHQHGIKFLTNQQFKWLQLKRKIKSKLKK